MDQDRLNHSLAVARKMVEIGKTHNLPEKDLRALFLLGLTHDIGYEFGTPETHATLGADILESCGFKYAEEVRHHGYCTFHTLPLFIVSPSYHKSIIIVKRPL